jgi:hypothetical protein
MNKHRCEEKLTQADYFSRKGGGRIPKEIVQRTMLREKLLVHSPDLDRYKCYMIAIFRAVHLACDSGLLLLDGKYCSRTVPMNTDGDTLKTYVLI